MKKVFIVIILIYSFNVVASEIGWNTTEITSKNHFSFLEERFDDNVYFQIKKKEIVDITQTNLSISSWYSFKKALINFFSNEEDSSHFLSIHTPNILSDRIKSNN
mgnify:CR=1 FL=1